jgi:hypothetical protein
MQAHLEWSRIHLIYMQVDCRVMALQDPIDRIPRPVIPTDMINDNLRHWPYVRAVHSILFRKLWTTSHYLTVEGSEVSGRPPWLWFVSHYRVRPIYYYPLSEAFTKLQKVSLCLSVYPPIRHHGKTLRSHWTDFYEIWYLSIFENLSGKLKFH